MLQVRQYSARVTEFQLNGSLRKLEVNIYPVDTNKIRHAHVHLPNQEVSSKWLPAFNLKNLKGMDLGIQRPVCHISKNGLPDLSNVFLIVI